MKKVEAIDLFCWIWWLSVWLENSNINVLAWLDFDEKCRVTYENNHKWKFIQADVSKYDFKKLKNLYSKNSIKVLVWCAPCQPFSSHSYKIRKNNENIQDERWNLIDHFVRAIDELNPDYISMENVRWLIKTDIFNKFINSLKKRNYYIDYKVVYCPNYWIPQNRQRLVLLGSKKSEINIPKETHEKGNYITVWDTIKNINFDNDPLNKSIKLGKLNLERIKQSKPKWTWKDWDPKLLPECYKRESWQTYTSVYWRMSWDDIWPTMTTQFCNYGSGRFWHPIENRALNLREWALLQTFPLNYKFDNKQTLTALSRQIGNAVPPKLGEAIWNTIISHIKKYYE